MRDPLPTPPTTLFTLKERNATEGPPAHPCTPHRRQNPPPRPCNIVLHPGRGASRSEESRVSASGPAFPSHSQLVTRHCIFDRYTCRTKNAVSPSPSSKLPNLIDTDSHPSRMRILRANIVSRRISPSAPPCYVVLHTAARRQNISAPLPRDFSRNFNGINKTATISRHVFARLSHRKKMEGGLSLNSEHNSA